VFKALGLGAVQPTLQASSLKSVGDDRRGAASCTYYLGTDIGQAFAPMLGGVVAVASSYNIMFLLFALPQLVGIAYYAWLTRKQAAR
jgi:MFS family permease